MKCCPTTTTVKILVRLRNLVIFEVFEVNNHVTGPTCLNSLYELTNFGWDYAYDCERDMIDAGPIGSFGRFINHQDTPNAEAQSVVNDKKLAIKKALSMKKILKLLKTSSF